MVEIHIKFEAEELVDIVEQGIQLWKRLTAKSIEYQQSLLRSASAPVTGGPQG